MGYTSLDSVQQPQQKHGHANGSSTSSRGSSQDPGYRSTVGLSNGNSSQKSTYRYGPTSSPGHIGSENSDKYRWEKKQKINNLYKNLCLLSYTGVVLD